MRRIGLQLWSVKDHAGQDFFKTLESVRESGYDGVEFAGTFGKTAEELKAKLDTLGLIPCGSHIGIDAMLGDMDGVIRYNAAIGNKNLIVPGLPGDMFNSREAWLKTAEVFNKLGAQAAREGMQIYFHNHDREFDRFGDKTGMELLFENTDTLHFELDTFWVNYAGFSSVEYMRKFGARCSLLHIKELKPGPERVSTIIGEGLMDFPPILALAKEMGIEWYVIEQEEFDGDALEETAKGCANLRKMLG